MDRQEDLSEFFKVLNEMDKQKLQEFLLQNPNYEQKIQEKLIIDNKLNKKLIKSLSLGNYLENCIIPNFEQNEIDNLVLIQFILIFNNKLEENSIFLWNINNPIFNEELFQKVYSAIINNYNFATQNNQFNSQIILYLINLFQNFENDFISNRIFKLVSSPLLLQVSKVQLKKIFLEYPKIIALYKKLLEKQQEIEQDKEIYFMSKLITLFFNGIKQFTTKDEDAGTFNLICRLLQLFIELLSTIPLRKYFKFLLLNSNFLQLKLTKPYQTNEIIRNFSNQLKSLLQQPINEYTGELLPHSTQLLLRTDFFSKLEQILFKEYDLMVSPFELESLSFVELLPDGINSLKFVMNYMNISIPEEVLFREISEEDFEEKLLLNIFEEAIPKEKADQNNLKIYPNEKLLFDDMLSIANTTNKEEIDFLLNSKVRRLNLQYLSLDDYLDKNTKLFRLESAYEVKQDIQETIERINPQFNHEGIFMKCSGWAKMATEITKFTLHYIAPALLGEEVPSKVMAEVQYSIQGMPTYIRKEWESLHAHDTIFLLSLQQNSPNYIKFLRGAEISAHLDENNKQINDRSIPEGKVRTLQLLLDPEQYKEDLQMETREVKLADLYENFHFIVRRLPKANIFKPILCTLTSLRKHQQKLALPNYLIDGILGYGDSKEISSLSRGIKQNIDLYDLFIDQAHYQEAFINNKMIQEEIKQKCKWVENSYQLTDYNEKNSIRFTNQQTCSIVAALCEGLTLINGPPGTGKTDTTTQILSLLLHNSPNERILLLTHSNKALDDLIFKLQERGIYDKIVRLGRGGKYKEYTREGRIREVLLKRIKLLEDVSKIQNIIKGKLAEEVTCETADVYFRIVLKKLWEEWRQNIKEGDDISTCPLIHYFNVQQQSNIITLSHLDYCWQLLCDLFKSIQELHAFEILRFNKERSNFIVSQYSRILAMTCSYACMKRDYFLKIYSGYDSIVCEEAAQILEIESFVAMNLQNQKRVKRVVLIGDENQLPPIIKHPWFQKKGNMELSFFKRMIRLGMQKLELEHQGRARDSILQLYQWQYPYLKSLEGNKLNQEKQNQGQFLKNQSDNLFYRFFYDYQFINVQPFEGKGEICPSKHFHQNLAEAEFVVATYMYMVMKGYDPQKISILTTYNGQKCLIRDIIKAKCSWNSKFGNPKTITTVDKYQGQQNDYILLSLVRTKHIGHLKDPRRLIVAISRARLGLYVFGRFDIFANYKEIKQTFDLFKERPQELHLQLTDDQSVQPQNFQELYQIVINMINEDKK